HLRLATYFCTVSSIKFSAGWKSSRMVSIRNFIVGLPTEFNSSSSMFRTPTSTCPVQPWVWPGDVLVLIVTEPSAERVGQRSALVVLQWRSLVGGFPPPPGRVLHATHWPVPAVLCSCRSGSQPGRLCQSQC